MTHALTLMLALAGVFSVSQAQAQQQVKPADQLVSQCIGCHGIPGYQSSFPEVHKVPMISGQSAKYIAAALNAYKKGDRKHPTMRGIATSMTDQDIEAVAAYYEKHGAEKASPVPDAPAPAKAEVAALLAKGACVSCHGANFNKPIDPSYPKIAGQHPDYLYVALKAYHTQGNPQIGRNNAIMAGQVKQFTLPELKAMAGYIGSLPGELRTVPQSRFR